MPETIKNQLIEEERKILYVDVHLFPSLWGRSDCDNGVYKETIDGVHVYSTYNSFDGSRLCDEETFDMLGLHLSTTWAYGLAVAFRRKNRHSPIVVWSKLPTRDSRRFMDEISFPYDAVRFEYGLSGLDEKLRNAVMEFMRIEN